ncbi:MAG: hypothetical protein FWB91_06620 [Defluviitaleaceae bacterium]|nr:hypothetical protein [Defluviitaleaceae bacterium]
MAKRRSNFIVRGGADFSGVKRGFTDLKKQTAVFSKSMRGLLKGALAFFGIRAIRNFARDTRQAFRQVAQDQQRLANVMWAGMGATDDAIRSTLGLMRGLQRTGVVSADTLTSGAHTLSGFLSDTVALKNAIPVLGNLGVAMHGIDVKGQQMAQTAELYRGNVVRSNGWELCLAIMKRQCSKWPPHRSA